jgi:hypothetical protein
MIFNINKAKLNSKNLMMEMWKKKLECGHSNDTHKDIGAMFLLIGVLPTLVSLCLID